MSQKIYKCIKLSNPAIYKFVQARKKPAERISGLECLQLSGTAFGLVPVRCTGADPFVLDLIEMQRRVVAINPET